MALKKRQWTNSVKKAAATTAAASVIGAPALPAKADGGTIQFVGAIVAAPIDITVDPPHASRPGSGVNSADVAGSNAALEITFRPPPGSADQLDVTWQTRGGTTGSTMSDAATARLVDGTGRPSAPAANGHYRVGEKGGVLSLAPKPGREPVLLTLIIRHD